MPAVRYCVPFGFDEMPFEEAVELAADTGRISSTAGPLLETVVDMLDELGRPDRAFDCIQVAGTNGKTSTTRFTAAILHGEVYRAACNPSPCRMAAVNRVVEVLPLVPAT